jgi:uroporphyrinogen III methyltransferase/synthase
VTATASRKSSYGTVALVGAGPGDPELLTVRAADLIARADVVVADVARVGAALAGRRADAELVDVTGGAGADVAKGVAAHAKAGRSVVVAYADPLSSANGVALALALTKAKLPWELVPGVHEVSAVPSYSGVVSFAPGKAVTIVDVDDNEPDWSALAGAETLVVAVSAEQVGKVASQLSAAGRDGSTPVVVTVEGTTASQRSLTTTLDSAHADVADLSGRAVLILGPGVKQRDRLAWFENRPLFGWRVLVPRTKEQAGVLSEQLRAYGAVPVEVPTIAVEPPRTPVQMDRAVKGLVSGRYQWIAFTSTNAFRAVREKLEEYGLDARAFAGIKIACVGEQTAAAVREYGIKPELVPSGDQSSEGLLAEWPEYDDVLDPIDRVLLPRADIATEALAAGLQERGWEVDDVTAYRTVRAAPPAADIREAIKSGGFDAVLFTSSSTVRNLVGIAGKPHENTVVAVIGPQTEATADEHGLKVAVRAETPSVSALVEALAEYAAEDRARALAEGLAPRPTERLAKKRAGKKK